MAERIECDGDLRAFRANDGGLEKAVEQVQYHGVVAFLVDFPGLGRYLLKFHQHAAVRN